MPTCSECGSTHPQLYIGEACRICGAQERQSESIDYRQYAPCVEVFRKIVREEMSRQASLRPARRAGGARLAVKAGGMRPAGYP